MKPTNDTVAVGDVLLQEPNQPTSLWRIGRVEKLLHGADRVVRGASLRVQSGDRHPILLRRPVQHIYPPETDGVSASVQQPVTTHEPVTTQEPEEDWVDPVDPNTEDARKLCPRRAAAHAARFRLHVVDTGSFFFF